MAETENDNIQNVDNTNTDTTDIVDIVEESNTTELEVSPASIAMKVGDTKTLAITTNALDFTITSSNDSVVSVSKPKKQIKGIGKGDAQVTITAQVTGGELVTKVITCHIAQNINLDFGSENEILENIHHYDETLPLSVNGTIAYKKGENDSDPLIKLVFDGRLQRWQVIGIKITKWNTENEPYNLYFMASEGAVGNALSNMNLQKVIIDLIDSLFVSETPNMTNTIRQLFNDVINPAVERELQNIPQLVQNEITEELERIIKEKIKSELNTQFDIVIEENIDKKIGEYEFSRITPYHKTQKKPKWVGVLIANFKENSLMQGNLKYISRRLNTNGIEERWMSHEEMKINDCSNDDELTRLFDSLEPYKSMERMEIMCSDLANIVGDSIYGKDMFQRLMSQSNDKNHKLFNGSFYQENYQDILNRESVWFVPLKKSHYIEVEFSLVGNDNDRYKLFCVGEEEFEVNLKDYFPNAMGIKLDYFTSARAGYKEFYVNDMTIRSQVHPCFLNYYDEQCNILSNPMELDYVYIGAFNDVLVRLPENYKGISTNTQCYMSRPFGDIISRYNIESILNSNWHYWLGMNPKVGVNIKGLEYNYVHFVHILRVIEMGHNVIAYNTKNVLKSSWKWFQDVNTAITKSGHTFFVGNKTARNNYRGIENIFSGYYDKCEGVYQDNHSSLANVLYHLPHSHRFRISFNINHIREGLHWIDVGHSHQNVGYNQNYTSNRLLANSLCCHKVLEGYQLQNNSVTKNERYFYIGTFKDKNFVEAHWAGAWDGDGSACVSRSCI